MTKNEEVAKIIEENFGLKTDKGTYRRNRRTEWEKIDGYMAWEMKVNDAQFPPVGTPREECKIIKLFNMMYFRDMTFEEKCATMGIYDEYFDNRNSRNYVLGSTHSLQDILDTIKYRKDGIKYIYLRHTDTLFEIDISDRKLEYKGDYDDALKKLKIKYGIYKPVEEPNKEIER